MFSGGRGERIEKMRLVSGGRCGRSVRMGLEGVGFGLRVVRGSCLLIIN